MEKLTKLRNEIETLREELNDSLITDQYEVYYKKSVELDNLIAEYIDLEEQIPA